MVGLPRWLSGRLPAMQRRRFNPGSGRSLEKEMATFPGFLPGKSQGQRSLVGYTSFGHKRVGHDLATKQQQQTWWLITSEIYSFWRPEVWNQNAGSIGSSGSSEEEFIPCLFLGSVAHCNPWYSVTYRFITIISASFFISVYLLTFSFKDTCHWI